MERDDEELEGARVRAVWPWALFAAALLAGIVAFFLYAPRG